MSNSGSQSAGQTPEARDHYVEQAARVIANTGDDLLAARLRHAWTKERQYATLDAGLAKIAVEQLNARLASADALIEELQQERSTSSLREKPDDLPTLESLGREPGYKVESPCGRAWFVPKSQVLADYVSFLMEEDKLTEEQAREKAAEGGDVEFWLTEQFNWSDVKRRGTLIKHASAQDIQNALDVVQSDSGLRVCDLYEETSPAERSAAPATMNTGA